MTEYIDREDAAAIRRRAEHEFRTLAEDAAARAAPALFGLPEDQMRAGLDAMAQALVAELDRLERQALADIGALCMNIEEPARY